MSSPNERPISRSSSTSTSRRKILQVTLFKGGGTDTGTAAGGPDDDSSQQCLSSSIVMKQEGSPNPNSAMAMAIQEDEESKEIRIRTVPVLAFDFFSLNSLRRLLKSPTQFSGLIFTSPRCIEALEKCVEEDESTVDDDEAFKTLWETQLKDMWKSKPVFCVGPSTVSRFESFVGSCSSIIVSKNGNAKSLAEVIVQEHLRTAAAIQLPLLYPCGTLKRDSLGNILNEAKIPFECITVYKTIQNPDLVIQVAQINTAEDIAKNSAEKEQIPVYVFYSPSGVNFTIPLLNDVSTKHVVAIGPTTKEALEQTLQISPSKLYQCSAPTNEALTEVLKTIKRDLKMADGWR